MTTYRAVAPLVLVKNQNGHIDYHYEGAVIPWLSPEQAKRFLDEGFVVKEGDAVEPGPVGLDYPPDAQPAVEDVRPPAQVATKDVWVDYAVSQGHDREQAESLTKAELIELFKE